MSGFIGTNPNIPVGNLNRLLASLIFPNFPLLTITQSYLTKEGIQLAFRGDATTQLDVMASVVTAQEPYLGVTLTAHVLRSQGFSQIWRTQLELSSLLGPAIARTDSVTQAPYFFTNCSIISIGDQALNGTSPDYPIRIGGVYPINASLYP